MGILSRFRKEEVYNKDTGKFEPKQKEIKELTREEQMEPKRQHPWQTPRGKQFIKSTKHGIKRVDRAIVKYNRRSTMNNANPFGSTFDKGIPKPRKKKTSSSSYVIVGGKAYPKAKTHKKKKKKSSSRRRSDDPFNFDMVKWR